MELCNVTFIVNGKFPEDTDPQIISGIRERLDQCLRDEIENLTQGKIDLEVESDWEYSEEENEQ